MPGRGARRGNDLRTGTPPDAAQLAKIQAAFGRDPVRGPLSPMSPPRTTSPAKTAGVSYVNATLLPETSPDIVYIQPMHLAEAPSAQPTASDAVDAMPVAATPELPAPAIMPPELPDAVSAAELPASLLHHLKAVMHTHDASWKDVMARAEEEWRRATADALTRAKARHEADYRVQLEAWGRERRLFESKIAEEATLGRAQVAALQSRLEAALAVNAEMQKQLDDIADQFVPIARHKNEVLVLEIKLAAKDVAHKEEVTALKVSHEAVMTRMAAQLTEAQEQLASHIRNTELETQAKIAAEISKIQDIFANQWREREDSFRAQWEAREAATQQELATQSTSFQALLNAARDETQCEKDAHAATQAALDRTKATLEGTAKSLEKLRRKVRNIMGTAGVSPGDVFSDTESVSSGFAGETRLRSESLTSPGQTAPGSSGSLRRRSSWNVAKQAFQRSTSLSQIVSGATGGESVEQALEVLLRADSADSDSTSSPVATAATSPRVSLRFSPSLAPLHEATAHEDDGSARGDQPPPLQLGEATEVEAPATDLSVAQKLSIPSSNESPAKRHSVGSDAGALMLSERTRSLLFRGETPQSTRAASPSGQVLAVATSDVPAVTTTGSVEGGSAQGTPTAAAAQAAKEEATHMRSPAPPRVPRPTPPVVASELGASGLSDLERLAASPVGSEKEKSGEPIEPMDAATSPLAGDAVSVDDDSESDEDHAAADQLHEQVAELVQQYESEAELSAALTSEVSRLTELSASLLRDNQDLHGQLTRANGQNQLLTEQGHNLTQACAAATARGDQLANEVAVANAAIDDLRAQLTTSQAMAEELREYATRTTQLREELATALLALAFSEAQNGVMAGFTRPDALVAEMSKAYSAEVRLLSEHALPDLIAHTVASPTRRPVKAPPAAQKLAALPALPPSLEDDVGTDHMRTKYAALQAALRTMFPVLKETPVAPPTPTAPSANLDQLLERVHELASQASAAIRASDDSVRSVLHVEHKAAEPSDLHKFPVTPFEPTTLPNVSTTRAGTADEVALATRFADSTMQATWRANYAGLLSLLSFANQPAPNRPSASVVAHAVLHFLRALARAAGVNADATIELLSSALRSDFTGQQHHTPAPTIEISSPTRFHEGSGDVLSPHAHDLMDQRTPSKHASWAASLQSHIHKLTQQVADGQREQGHALGALALARETIATLSLQLAFFAKHVEAVAAEKQSLQLALAHSEQVVKTLLPRLEATSAQVAALNDENFALEQQNEKDRRQWATSVADISATAYALYHEVTKLHTQAQLQEADGVKAAKAQAVTSSQELEAHWRSKEAIWSTHEAQLHDRIDRLTEELAAANAASLQAQMAMTPAARQDAEETQALRLVADKTLAALSEQEGRIKGLEARIASDQALIHTLQGELQRATSSRTAPVEEAVAPVRSPRRAAPGAPASFASTYRQLEHAHLQTMNDRNELSPEKEGKLYVAGITGPGAGAALPRDKHPGSVVGVNSTISFSRPYGDVAGGAADVSSPPGAPTWSLSPQPKSRPPPPVPAPSAYPTAARIRHEPVVSMGATPYVDTLHARHVRPGGSGGLY